MDADGYEATVRSLAGALRVMRAERDRYREALSEAKALLADMVRDSPKTAPLDCTNVCSNSECNCSGIPTLGRSATAAKGFIDRWAALDGEDKA